MAKRISDAEYLKTWLEGGGQKKLAEAYFNHLVHSNELLVRGDALEWHESKLKRLIRLLYAAEYLVGPSASDRRMGWTMFGVTPKAYEETEPAEAFEITYEWLNDHFYVTFNGLTLTHRKYVYANPEKFNLVWLPKRPEKYGGPTWWHPKEPFKPFTGWARPVNGYFLALYDVRSVIQKSRDLLRLATKESVSKCPAYHIVRDAVDKFMKKLGIEHRFQDNPVPSGEPVSAQTIERHIESRIEGKLCHISDIKQEIATLRKADADIRKYGGYERFSSNLRRVIRMATIKNFQWDGLPPSEFIKRIVAMKICGTCGYYAEDKQLIEEGFDGTCVHPGGHHDDLTGGDDRVTIDERCDDWEAREEDPT